MSVDRELLKEVTQELWNTVKKLRPEIDRETRLQLVLKALLTIGDLPDQLQAAMVVGVCAEMDKSDIENADGNSNTKEEFFKNYDEDGGSKRNLTNKKNLKFYI